MIDLLLPVGVSNLCMSFGLALAAWAIQHTGRHPRVAHLLWLVVLVKLITPAVFTIPVIDLPAQASNVTVATSELPTGSALGATAASAFGMGATGLGLPAAPAGASRSSALKTSLFVLWMLGSAVVLVGSLTRIVRFHRLLLRASAEAPAALQRVASGIAEQLGLSVPPTVYTTRARLSPLVWWVGGRVRVVLCADLTRDMTAEQLHWALAHELAHVRRRDHMVRWIEWLACVLCWWNPVAWWARRNLRRNEELCCDALVLSSLKPSPRAYAGSLLSVVEFLSAPSLRPPAMASGMNSGGSLERRLKMIVSTKSLAPTPRWLTAIAMLGVLVVLPLGIAQAGEPDYVAVGNRLQEAVRAGELTAAQAEAMMGELARARFGERMVASESGRGDMRKKLHAVGLKVRAAVAAGELSVDEGRAKMAAFRESLGAWPSREEMGKVKKEIWDAVKAGEVTEEQAEERWREYLNHVRGGDARGGAPSRRAMPTRDEVVKVKKDIWAAVKAGEVTEEQAKERLREYLKRVRGGDAKTRGEAREDDGGSGLEGAFARLGFATAHVERMRKHLRAQGLTEEQTEQALGGLVRITFAMKEQREDFELDPAILEYLQASVGLGEEQVEMLLGVARRMAAAGERRER